MNTDHGQPGISTQHRNQHQVSTVLVLMLRSVSGLSPSAVACQRCLMSTRSIANGAAIRAIREARGISLRSLATEVGYNPGHLSRVERGLHGGSEFFVHEVARALSVTPSALTKAAA